MYKNSTYEISQADEIISMYEDEQIISHNEINQDVDSCAIDQEQSKEQEISAINELNGINYDDKIIRAMSSINVNINNKLNYIADNLKKSEFLLKELQAYFISAKSTIHLNIVKNIMQTNFDVLSKLENISKIKK